MTTADALLELGLADSFRALVQEIKAAGQDRAWGLLDAWKQDVLRKRYRELALKRHPDRGGDAALMARLTEAYQLVMKTKVALRRRRLLRLSVRR